MDLTEMRGIVRCDLHDEDAANYRWTDDEIHRHIARAVKEFSEALPLEQTATLATTAGSREINIVSLSSRVMVEAVEFPAGNFPKQFQRFSLWSDTITLLGDEVPDGTNCCVYYGKLHTLDGSGSTVPSQYEELIAGGAAGYAAIEWAMFAVNRVNIGGTGTPEDFLNWGKERLNLFRAELKRLSRRNRVRARTLYQPYQAVKSKTRDYGP